MLQHNQLTYFYPHFLYRNTIAVVGKLFDMTLCSAYHARCSQWLFFCSNVTFKPHF